MKSDQALAAAQALSDRAWAMMTTAGASDIQRIAKNGPDGSDHDRTIVRSVFSFVDAEIQRRCAEIDVFEGNAGE